MFYIENATLCFRNVMNGRCKAAFSFKPCSYIGLRKVQYANISNGYMINVSYTSLIFLQFISDEKASHGRRAYLRYVIEELRPLKLLPEVCLTLKIVVVKVLLTMALICIVKSWVSLVCWYRSNGCSSNQPLYRRCVFPASTVLQWWLRQKDLRGCYS